MGCPSLNPFAALADGDKCYCSGNERGIVSGGPVQEEKCNSKCTGDLNYNCGGKEFVDIYVSSNLHLHDIFYET